MGGHLRTRLCPASDWVKHSPARFSQERPRSSCLKHHPPAWVSRLLLTHPLDIWVPPHPGT